MLSERKKDSLGLLFNFLFEQNREYLFFEKIFVSIVSEGGDEVSSRLWDNWRGCMFMKTPFMHLIAFIQFQIQVKGTMGSVFNL